MTHPLTAKEIAQIAYSEIHAFRDERAKAVVQAALDAVRKKAFDDVANFIEPFCPDGPDLAERIRSLSKDSPNA